MLSSVKILLLALCTLSALAEAVAQAPERLALLARADSVYASRDKLGAYPLYQALATGRGGQEIADSLTGYAFHKMGVCAQYTDRPFAAVDSYRRAIAVRTDVLGWPHNDIAKSQANLAALFRGLNEPDSMATYLYRATAGYEALPHPDTINWARALGDLAWLASLRFDCLLLRDATDKANELFIAPNSPVYEDEVALLRYNFGTYFFFCKDLEEATRYTDYALRYGEEQADSSYLSSCHNTYYLIANARDESEAARANLQRAIALYPSYGTAEELGIYYSNLAQLELKTNQFEDSELSAETALGLLPAGYAEVPFVHRTLARLAVAEKDFPLAYERYNTAIRSLSDSTYFTEGHFVFQPLDRLTDERLSLFSNLLVDRARLLAKTGGGEAVPHHYRLAILCDELLRARVTSDASRRFLSEDIRPVFDAAIRLAIVNDNLWQALLLSDQARAYTLNANLQRNRENLTTREAELDRRIGRLEATAYDDADLKSELVAARLERDRIRRQSAGRVVADTTSLTAATVTQYLASTQNTLFQYHVTEDTSLVFRVTPAGEISFHYLPGAQALSESTQAFRELIRKSAYRRKSLRTPAEQLRLDEDFITSGGRLARSLVPGKWEEPGDGKGRILLIPDGALSFFPFAALPLSGGSGPVDYAAIDYLGTGHTIRHAYSLSTLLSRKGTAGREGKLVAIAPTFSGALGQLTENEREVNAITEVGSGATAITGAQATRAAFLASCLASNILHLSTHGFSDAANPDGSWIAFSQSGSELDPEELIYYPEIASLPIDADLVVLSACETSLGKYAPGETSLSLASAFTSAGARSTVNTLWRVDDRATADMMVAFYAGLSEGEGRADALRRAQGRLITDGEFAHPYFWAGVALTGADGPVGLGLAGLGGWVLLLGGGALVVGLVLGIRSIRS